MTALKWDAQRWAPRFFTIWGGQVFSLLGSRIVQFALVWWLTRETGSGLVLSTATIAALVPGIVSGLVVGPFIDRWNRRHVMLVADSLIALATLCLALLFAFDLVQLWHIYVIIFLRSIGGSFHWPAMQASTTLMVPEQLYSRVAGLNQSLQGAAGILGPIFGAFLIEVLPMQGVLSVDIVTAAIAVIPLLLIAIPQPERAAGKDRMSFLHDMLEGWRFVASWRGLMLVVLIAMLLNFLLAPASTLLPLLVVNHFGGGQYHFAFLQTATGVGVIVGGLLLTAWGGFKRRMATALFGVILLGCAAGLLGLTPATMFWMAIAAAALLGLMQPIANGSITAALQASTPPDMQGRLFSLVGASATAMMPLGLLIAGPLSDRYGANTWFLIGGGAAIILGAIGFFFPSILNLEREGARLAAARHAGQGTAAEEDAVPSVARAAE